MAPPTQQDWLVLIYNMSNQKGLRKYTERILGQIASTPLPQGVKVVFQMTLSSRSTHPIRRYDFQTGPAGKRPVDPVTGLEYSPQKDLSPVRNLSAFIRSCRRQYPSRHCAVVLQGHAWGVDYKLPSVDVSSHPTTKRAASAYRNILGFPQQHDTLNNLQLQQALAQGMNGEKLDLFGMDACLMGMAEILYQLRNCSDYIVATEGLSPLLGWPFPKILPALKSGRKTLNGRSFGQLTLHEYQRTYKSFGGRSNLTMGLYDLKRAEALAAAVKTLSAVLMAALTNRHLFRAIVKARVHAAHVDFASYIDLYDLCDRLAKEIKTLPREVAGTATARSVIEASKKIKRIQHNHFVVSTALNRGRPVHGLTIYFPDWQIGSRKNKGRVSDGYYGIRQTPSTLRVARQRIATAYLAHDFAGRTGWDKFLGAFLEARAIHHPPPAKS